jgi:hypothetical protein
MLRDSLSAVSPVLGLCDHPYRLAELILLAITCFCLGFCIGGCVIGFLLSPRLRLLGSRLVIFLLEGAEIRPREGGLAGQDRLQRYRA